MIKEIIMAGIKGQNTVQPLTGKDIIVGNNGSGKTTRMQAMSLAAFGYVPGKGKTAEATYELASDDTMKVGITTDEISILREYTKTSKLTSNGTLDVKISQGITLSPNMGESTIKQKEQRISEALGNFPTMLDFASFIELTDNKKRDFIYNLSGDRFTWTRERIAHHLQDMVLREELYLNNPDMYEVMGKNYNETMAQFPEDQTDVQSGLLAMSEHAKERLSYWKKEKQTADAAARKLTELKNRSVQTDRDIADNQDKLRAMEQEKEDLNNELAEIKAHNQIVDEKLKELQNMRDEIKQLEEETDTEERIRTLQDAIEYENELLEECYADIKNAQDEASTKMEDREDIIRRMEEKSAYITKMEAEIAVHKTTIKNNTKLIDNINQNKGCCAFSKDIPCGHDFSEFIEKIQCDNDMAYDRIDEITLDIDLQRDAFNEMSEDSDNLRRDIMKANEVIRKGLSAKEVMTGKIQQLKDELQKLENISPIITSKAHQASEIQAWIDENPKKEEESHKENIDGLKAKIEALKTTIDEQKRVRNDILNIKANIIDSQTAAYEQECWAQIAEAIGQKGIQGEMVKEMLDPLRILIDEKLNAMGIDKRFYFETESDRGKEVFRFGWIDRGDKRPFNALSQGEQLMLLIALMTTIIERSNPPIKVLAIDNINHLDAQNLKKIIQGLNEAGKNMDNIILAGTPEITPEDAPEWTVWNL